jgi:hypothetical protein
MSGGITAGEQADDRAGCGANAGAFGRVTDFLVAGVGVVGVAGGKIEDE